MSSPDPCPAGGRYPMGSRAASWGEWIPSRVPIMHADAARPLPRRWPRQEVFCWDFGSASGHDWLFTSRPHRCGLFCPPHGRGIVRSLTVDRMFIGSLFVGSYNREKSKQKQKKITNTNGFHGVAPQLLSVVFFVVGWLCIKFMGLIGPGVEL